MPSGFLIKDNGKKGYDGRISICRQKKYELFEMG